MQPRERSSNDSVLLQIVLYIRVRTFILCLSVSVSLSLFLSLSAKWSSSSSENFQMTLSNVLQNHPLSPFTWRLYKILFFKPIVLVFYAIMDKRFIFYFRLLKTNTLTFYNRLKLSYQHSIRLKLGTIYIDFSSIFIIGNQLHLLFFSLFIF